MARVKITDEGQTVEVEDSYTPIEGLFALVAEALDRRNDTGFWAAVQAEASEPTNNDNEVTTP